MTGFSRDWIRKWRGIVFLAHQGEKLECSNVKKEIETQINQSYLQKSAGKRVGASHDWLTL